MTRENYVAISKIIEDNIYPRTGSVHKYISIGLIHDLCTFFKKDNPRFNEDKFLELCRGLNSKRG